MSVSSNVEDRTLHGLYMWLFANAVKASVANVMCAYNRVNSFWAYQNGLLKTELRFQSFIISDWMGTHTGYATAESGLDITMPGVLCFDKCVNVGNTFETHGAGFLSRIQHLLGSGAI